MGRGWKAAAAAAGAVVSGTASVVAGLEPHDLLTAAQWTGERLLAIALLVLIITVCVGDLSFSVVRSGGKNTSFVLGFGGRWRPAVPSAPPQPQDAADDETANAESSSTAPQQLRPVPNLKVQAPRNVRGLPEPQDPMREDDLYALRLLESEQPLPPYWSGYIMGRFVVDQIPNSRGGDPAQLALPLQGPWADPSQPRFNL